MTEMDEPTICRDTKNPSSSFQYCINCSTSLTNRTNECQVSQMETDSQNVSNHLTIKTVFSVFQLDYLKAFESRPEWTDNESSKSRFSLLCSNCSQIFNSLYQIYKKLDMMKHEFLQLGSLDSYLSKQLTRLDEIIDCHQQRTIKCDLIKINEQDEHEQDSDIVDQSGPDLNSGDCSIISQNHHNYHKVFVVAEPQIVLTPLPKKYSKLSTEKSKNEDEDPESDDESTNSFVSPSDEEEDFSTIKLELDDNDDPHISSTFSTTDQDDDDSSIVDTKVECEEDEVDPLALEETVRDIKITDKFSGISERSLITNPSLVKPIERTTRLKNSVRNIRKATSNLLMSSSTLLERYRNNNINHQEKVNETKGQNEIEILSQQTTKTRSGHLETVIDKGSKPTSKIKMGFTIHSTLYRSKKTKYANPCWHCRSHFPTPEDCLEHTKNEHFDEFLKYSSDAIICQTCSKICKSSHALYGHGKLCRTIPRNTILQKKFQCDKCSKMFATPFCLKVHRKTHNDDRPFACPTCPFAAKSSRYLQSHVMHRHTPKPIQNNNVEKIFCDVCGNAFKDQTTLKVHQRSMHSQEGRQAYRESLEKRKIQHKIKRAKAPKLSTLCDDCGIDFYSRLALANHRLSVHADNMGKNFVCDQCGRAFRNPGSLNYHIKNVHTEERNFVCHLCGKPQKTQVGLKKHLIRSHTEEGRRKFNQETREKNQRRKQRESLLAQLNQEKSNSSGQQQKNKDKSTTNKI